MTTPCIERPRWERKETVAQVVALNVARAQGTSERAYAQAAEVPRCSLRYWDRRRRGLEQAGVPGFVETPAGLAWVFRVVWAAVFVLTLRAPGGVRAVCEFLQLSGLCQIVASSYGSVQTMAVQMVTAVNLLGTEMRAPCGRPVDGPAGRPPPAHTALGKPLRGFPQPLGQRLRRCPQRPQARRLLRLLPLDFRKPMTGHIHWTPWLPSRSGWPLAP